MNKAHLRHILGVDKVGEAQIKVLIRLKLGETANWKKGKNQAEIKSN